MDQGRPPILEYARAESRWWKVARTLSRICMALALLGCLVGCGLMLWLARLPGADFELIGSVMVLMAAAALWVFGLVLGHSAANRSNSPRPRFYRWAEILPIPIVVGTMILLCGNVPQRLMLRLSRPAMDRFVAQVMKSRTLPKEARIGLYDASNFEFLPGGEVRFVVNCGFMETFGFAYSPSAPPAKGDYDSYDPAGGGWYHWCYSD